jgi:hypothetical protein
MEGIDRSQAMRVATVIGLASAAGFIVAADLGTGWAEMMMQTAVSAAMANRQGTGNLAGLTRASGAAWVLLLTLPVPLLAGAAIGALGVPRKALVAGALIAALTVASILGFASAAGLGGRDLARPELLHDGYERYVSATRRGEDLPPLSPEQLDALVVPEGLMDELDLQPSPMVVGGILVVTLGVLVGRAIGGIRLGARRHAGAATG